MNILNPIRRLRLRAELPAAAMESGWDFSDAWVKTLSHEISTWNITDMVMARQKMKLLLDLRTHMEFFGSQPEVTVRYGAPASPSPLAILNHPFFAAKWQSDVTLVVGAFKATLLWYGADDVIVTFVGCGRMLQEGSYTHIEDTARFIEEVTGIMLDDDDVFDTAGVYEPLIFDRVDGVWTQRQLAPVRR